MNTPLTDAAVIMVDGEQPLLIDDAPVVFASHARALERRLHELERAVENAISDAEKGCGVGVLLLNLKKSRIGKEG